MKECNKEDEWCQREKRGCTGCAYEEETADKVEISAVVNNDYGLAINKNCNIYQTADEMFEELDYKKYDNHPEHDLPPEPNMFSTQDVRQLYYEQKGILENGAEAIEHIEFDLIRKNVVCWARINGRFVVVPLSMQELKAINKKCQELGWL